MKKAKAKPPKAATSNLCKLRKIQNTNHGTKLKKIDTFYS
jgi:hypothetical protein